MRKYIKTLLYTLLLFSFVYCVFCCYTNKKNSNNINIYNDSIMFYNNKLVDTYKTIDSLKLNINILDSLMQIKKIDTVKIIRYYNEKTNTIINLNDNDQLILFSTNINNR